MCRAKHVIIIRWNTSNLSVFPSCARPPISLSFFFDTANSCMAATTHITVCKRACECIRSWQYERISIAKNIDDFCYKNVSSLRPNKCERDTVRAYKSDTRSHGGDMGTQSRGIAVCTWIRFYIYVYCVYYMVIFKVVPCRACVVAIKLPAFAAIRSLGSYKIFSSGCCFPSSSSSFAAAAAVRRFHSLSLPSSSYFFGFLLPPLLVLLLLLDFYFIKESNTWSWMFTGKMSVRRNLCAECTRFGIAGNALAFGLWLRGELWSCLSLIALSWCTTLQSYSCSSNYCSLLLLASPSPLPLLVWYERWFAHTISNIE